MLSEKSNRLLALLIMVLIFAAGFMTVLNLSVDEVTAAASTAKVSEASGMVNSGNGAFLRKSASVSSAKVTGLKNNTSLTIIREVFVTTKKTDNSKKWYYVKAGDKVGYIRADLVKRIKYKAVKATVKKKVNYRAGAGVQMKKKGVFKKGAKLNVILTAQAYGSNTIWYKVQKGAKQYYVSSSSVKIDPIPTKFTLSGVTYPGKIGEGSPFTLKGNIICTNPITQIEGGITDKNGKWIIRKKVNTSTTNFSISTIDADIKFGTLQQGKYWYKVIAYVGGKAYTQINEKFSVVEAKKAEKITNKAFELCWPADASSNSYSYGSGRATAAYAAALDKAFPNRSKWGAAPKVGASCDVFVGTVLRSSGADTSVPRGLDEQIEYYPSSAGFTRVNYTGNRNSLKSGDIIIFRRLSGNTHTCIYLKRDGKEYIAEANYTHTYARLVSAASSINSKLTTADKRYIYVFRIKEK